MPTATMTTLARMLRVDRSATGSGRSSSSIQSGSSFSFSPSGSDRPIRTVQIT